MIKILSGFLVAASSLVSIIGALAIASGSQMARNLMVDAITLLGKFIFPIVIAVGLWLRSVLTMTINSLFSMFYYMTPQSGYFRSLFGGNDTFYDTALTYFQQFALIIALFLFLFVLYRYFVGNNDESIGKAIARFIACVVLVVNAYTLVNITGNMFIPTLGAMAGGRVDFTEGNVDQTTANFNFVISENAPLLEGFNEAFAYYGGNYKEAYDNATGEEAELKKAYENEVEKIRKNLEKEIESAKESVDDEEEWVYDEEYDIWRLDGITKEDIADMIASVNSIMDIVAMGYQIINVIIMATVLINMIRMFFSLFERYIIWNINYLLSPFFFAGFASKKSSEIFWKFVTNLLLQEFLMMIGIWSCRIAFEAMGSMEYNYESLGGMLFYAAVMIGLTQIPISLEKYFQSVGLGASQQMGELGNTIMGAVQSMPNQLKSTLKSGSSGSRVITSTIPGLVGNTSKLGQMGLRMADTKSSGQVFGKSMHDKSILASPLKTAKYASQNFENGISKRMLQGQDGCRLAEANGLDISHLSPEAQEQFRNNFDMPRGSSKGTSYWYDKDGNKIGAIYSTKKPQGGIEPIEVVGKNGNIGYLQVGKLDENGHLTKGLQNGYLGKNSFDSPDKLNEFAKSNNLYMENGKSSMNHSETMANNKHGAGQNSSSFANVLETSRRNGAIGQDKAVHSGEQVSNKGTTVNGSVNSSGKGKKAMSSDFGVGATKATVDSDANGRKIGLNLQSTQGDVGYFAESGTEKFKKPGGKFVYDGDGNKVGKVFKYDSLSSSGHIDNSATVPEQQKQIVQNIANKNPVLMKSFNATSINDLNFNGGSNLNHITFENSKGEKFEIFDTQTMMNMPGRTGTDVHAINMAGPEELGYRDRDMQFFWRQTK